MKHHTTATSTRRSLLSFCVAMAMTGAMGLAHAQVPAPGLKAPGSLSYDMEGVPTIVAQNDEDAAWLMGYAHARDRIFQMDYLRRAASGTVAELLGPAALANDVQLRTLGLRRAAWATWAKAPAPLRSQLKAYSDGVNAWLRQNALPPEYQAIELSSVDPWTPVDSLVIGKLLAFQLSFDDETGYTQRLGAYQQAGQAAGFNGAALYFEDTHRIAPPDGRVSIPGFVPGGVAAAQDAGEKASVAKADVAAPSEYPVVSDELMTLTQQHIDAIKDNPILARQLNRRENRAGSNWWMVSGEHTASGAAILANDPHLALDMPVLFHEAHITSTDPRHPKPLNTAGLVAPGTPLPLLGCNTDFCWGLTTNSLDVTDTFQERFVLNSYGLPTHTIYNGQPEPVLWVFQSYFANTIGDGTADNLARVNSIGYTNGGVTIIVPRRNNGPVVSITGNTGISIQYSGWGPTSELDAFRRIARATNMEEFREAVGYFDVGSQNFAYADKEGNIAYFVSAEAPIREDLQAGTVNGLPPFLVRNGQGGNEWLARQNSYPAQALPYEILSPEEMPYVINPESGYIANANNDPVGNTLDNNALNQLRPGGGLYYLAPVYSAYRMGRIDRELQALIERGNITLDDMKTLQGNNQMLDAELVLPHLLAAWDNAPTCAAAADERVGEAIGILRDWDFSSPTGIPQGFDPGDTFPQLMAPDESEIHASVAATIWALFRGQVIRNTIDATLSKYGLASYLPGNDDAYHALKHHLDTFAQRNGKGASGIDFFATGVDAGLPASERRDCILLGSLKSGLDLAAGESFAAAFGKSSNLMDYRWGKLHRIVFDHPLGSTTPFSIPGPNPFPFANVGEGLPGVARSGGYQVVDASGHSARANSVNGFMFGSGPVRRFIGEMTDPPTLLQIMPGGQSGNITAGAGYISQLPRWLVNGYKPLVIDPAESAANEVATIPFAPK